MAKVARSLINEAKDGLTDEMFFTSKTMIEHFEKIIEGVTKTYHKKLKIVVINEGNSVACTNGDTIMVNLNNDWIKNAKSRVEKYYILVGLILHECGHVLYTDFKLSEKSMNALIHEDKLFPKIEISEALKEYFSEHKGRIFAKVYGAIDNCVEDGHIERRVIKYVPGYGECLMKVRKIHLSETISQTYEGFLKEEEEKCVESCRISIMVSLILTYAKFGIDNLGDVPEDDFTEAFNDIKDYIDTAVKTGNALKRKTEINRLFDRLVEFIAKEFEKETKSPDSSSSKDSESDEPEDKKDPSEKKDDSEKEEDSKENEGSDESKEADDPSGSEKEGDDAKSETKSETGDDSESEGESSSSKEELEKKLKDEMSKLEKMCEDMSDKSEHSSDAPASVPDDDDESEGFETPKEGDEFEVEQHEGPNEWDLSYLEDTVAEEEVAKAIKKGVVKKMKKTADDTRKGREDKFPSIETYVEPDDRAIEMFEKEHEECDRIARRVVKNLDKVIKERQKGDRLTGLYTGKSLDSAHAYRKDKKIFANKILPEKVPDMEVCVLVDCSGSMSCGTRMEQSRKCAYITWKFCKLMQIPCSVYGHTTDWHPEKHVLMTCVAHPDNIDKDDEKRIFMLRPEANNRDGWALNFCAESLVKSKASVKLLMVISDGIPMAAGYGEYLGKRDCQEVVRRYKRKGISVITAGIDDCADDIRRVYLDGVSHKEAAKFLDYSDMSQLPKAFATLIKKELL